MKKFVAVFICFLCCSGAMVLFAQAAATSTETNLKESDLYPVVIQFERIYAHADGYRIVYRRRALDMFDVYVPMSWFYSGGKAELVRGTGPEFSCMIVFYNKDKFDHIKIFVPYDVNDDRWGVFPQTATSSAKFKDVTDLKFEF